MPWARSNAPPIEVDLDARLTGIAAWLAHVKMALASSGEIRNGVVLPTAYATTSANSYETRTVRMALDAGTVKAVEISPPFDDMGRPGSGHRRQ